MCRGFHTLQKDEKMVDVTIAAGGKIFKAHKLVLSVCSPYFQQIFLENPSSHPILLMADVEAPHMAGLLDFMYSGQVNVKYEDLPVFLKVAEAMKIKGLHTEKNMNDDKENGSSQDGDSLATPTGSGTQCHFDRATHSVNITGHPYGQPPIQPQQPPQQPSAPPPPQSAAQAALEHSMNGTGGPLSPSPGFASFRDHIKSKASFAETFMKNLSRNNNNNSSINNYNNLGNSLPESTAITRKSDNFAILQANSKKILDTSRKPHKYLAKRKILMHYHEELNEKRRKEMDCYSNEPDVNSNLDVTLVEANSTTSENLDLTSAVSVSAISNSSSNNYKIRLMEKHQNDTAAQAAAAASAVVAETTTKHNNNEDAINNKESHATKESTPLEEEVTEALNLVQTSSTTSNSKTTNDESDKTSNKETTTSTAAINPLVPLISIKVEQPDLSYNMGNNISSGLSSGASSSGYSIGGRSSTSTSDEDELERERERERELERALGREREHENERERERERTLERERDRDRNQYHADYNKDEMETDSNNNNSKDTANLNKNVALIHAITRNLEHPKSDNNNNHTELDLSNTHLGSLGLVAGITDNETVKNIATAEILCGLKSKVFKMEKLDEERERERERENCRSLSEIKNAGD